MAKSSNCGIVNSMARMSLVGVQRYRSRSKDKQRVYIDPRYFSGVLFDLDGVITDTASIHQAAWAEMFDEFLSRRAPCDDENHHRFTSGDYRRYIDGRPRYDGIRDFLLSRGITLPWGAPSDSDLVTVCGLGNAKQQLFIARIATGVTRFASSVELVHRLTRSGVATAVYSASRNCAAVLEAAGIADLFAIRIDGVVADELGLPGKPDPAMLWEAARRLDVRPDRCVVIEDAEAGVAAGRAGGFGLIIGVDRSNTTPSNLASCSDSNPDKTSECSSDNRNSQALLAHGADIVISDLAEITVGTCDRRMSTLPDAVMACNQLASVISMRRPVFAFDFDGTLSEIVDNPHEAKLVPRIDKALQQLSTLYPVIVISGRDLADIRTRVGVDGLWYAGSHGFELLDPQGNHYCKDIAAEAIPVLQRAADELTQHLNTIAGVVMEHKRCAVAVHYRNVAPQMIATVLATVHHIGAQYEFAVTTGRKVIELRPNAHWDKGKALNWILEQFPNSEIQLPIYIGDDMTDEDAFDAVTYNGIGIIVRHDDDGDRCTAARYALNNPSQVGSFLEELMTQDCLCYRAVNSSWLFTYGGYTPEQERLREALCTVGNGYQATRGCVPEASSGPFHYPGTYGAGIYNRLVDDIAGVSVENESLVNLPNWLCLTFRINGGAWFDIDSCDIELLNYHHTMDLRHGELIREFRFRDSAGRTCHVLQRRIAAMNLQHVVALETTITAEDWSGTIEFRSLTDGNVRNAGVGRYKDLSGSHLVVSESCELSSSSTLLVCHTVQSRIVIAVAATIAIFKDHQLLECDTQLIAEDHRIGHCCLVSVDSGESITIEKMATICTSRDHAISEPALAAQRMLNQLDHYPDLRRGHIRQWAHLWESFDIEFDNNSDALCAIRLHLLHLLQSVPNRAEDLDAGVPARGLHGEAYRGHIFWDELFVFPVLNLRSPNITRSLLHYRYRRLPEARRAARDAGYAGAMFPWQSGSDGREESQRMHLNPRSRRWIPDASARAHHVGSAVAYNVWQYYQVSGDLEYLIEYGAEMLVEIARFWVSRTTWDKAKGRYGIRGVIGPDEFHSGYPEHPYDGIDNNAYTNVMAVWVILRACEALEALPLRNRLALKESLDIRSHELDMWDDISRRMYVPFHDGVISQFEGYDQLAELDWHSYRARYPTIARLDRILEAENDSVNCYKVSKQADVLMLLYLLSSDELRELLARLGYNFTPEQIPATVDYYLHRTSHGSTLSAVVHAWVLARGNRDRAMKYFRQVLASDIADLQGGTTAEGIHIAAMAGSIDLLQRCFTGLETRSDRLILSPMWPESLGALRLPIFYRGYRLHLSIHGSSVEISVDDTEHPPIAVECRGQVRTLTPGVTLRLI